MNTIRKAFNHVQNRIPKATYVLYTVEARWIFMDNEGKPLDFTDKNIDIGVLEDAADMVADEYALPKAFIL